MDVRRRNEIISFPIVDGDDDGDDYITGTGYPASSVGVHDDDGYLDLHSYLTFLCLSVWRAGKWRDATTTAR